MAKSKKITIPKEWTKKPIYWVIIIAILSAMYFIKKKKERVAYTPKIDNTALEITSIKNIAEWEFLTIQAEEMVDTVVKRQIIDDHFAKIYTGTLRLGVNLKKGRKNWIVCHGDSALVYLPEIELLDKNFLDETKTRTFFENGSLNATIRNKMTSKAKRKMKERALTIENITNAKENAKTQFTLMLNSIGYKNVDVIFAK